MKILITLIINLIFQIYKSKQLDIDPNFDNNINTQTDYLRLNSSSLFSISFESILNGNSRLSTDTNSNNIYANAKLDNGNSSLFMGKNNKYSSLASNNSIEHLNSFNSDHSNNRFNFDLFKKIILCKYLLLNFFFIRLK